MASASTPTDLATVPTEAAHGVEEDATLLIRKACKEISENYDLDHENSKKIVDMASAQRLGHPQACDLKFCNWHNAAITEAMKKYKDKYKKVKKYKEKVFQEFHKKQTSTIFDMKWAQYLNYIGVSPEPLFYNQVSYLAFKKSFIDMIKVPGEASTEVVCDLTYEEENAIRYMGGFVVRKLRKICSGDMEIAIEDLVNADDSEPEENEEWMGAIDRGGLIRVTTNMYQTLCAIEYVIRTYLRGDTVSTSGSEVIVEAVTNDADVQFHWNLASVQMDEEIGERLLDKIANQWLTIRQHSFAKSIMERYKRETKQSVQKKKPLRSTLSSKEGDLSSASDSD